jgi:hypothetical protein
MIWLGSHHLQGLDFAHCQVFRDFTGPIEGVGWRRHQNRRPLCTQFAAQGLYTTTAPKYAVTAERPDSLGHGAPSFKKNHRGMARVGERRPSRMRVFHPA